VLKGVEAAISRGDFPVGGVGKASRWGAGCVWSTEIEMHRLSGILAPAALADARD